MRRHTVTFLPEGVRVEVEAGLSVLEAAAQAGVAVSSPCGGQGACGKCRVHLHSDRGRGGPGSSPPTLSTQVALACQTAVEGDLVVEVRPTSPLRGAHLATSEPSPVVGPRAPEDPLAERVVTRIPPAGAAPGADADRLLEALPTACRARFECVDWDLPALRALPSSARSGGPVEAIIGDFDGAGRVIDVEPRRRRAVYGLAIDLGTTTVVVRLVDLDTGTVIGSNTQLNAQGTYGADVISRILHAQEKARGGEQLQEAVLGTIRGCVTELARQYRFGRGDVIAAVLAGNTVMTHLLLRIDPASIRREPYAPAVCSLPTLCARDVGLPIHPGAPVFLAPCVSSYVGGDIVAGALATGLAEVSELTLFIDLGTNGEIVVAQQDWMVCCSASAGPAFEGSGLSHGTYAREGAIERVFYDAAADQVHYGTIGGGPPLGICGSGYVDLLAELLRAGVVDRSGRLDPGFPSPRVRLRDDRPEFVVAWAPETTDGQEIGLGQDDIDNLLRAKSAVYAGVATLLEGLDLRASDVGRLLLAGGFGNHLNPDSAVTIGLLPDLPRERLQFVGNTALAGATRALLERGARRSLQSIAHRMTSFELSAVPGYMERYISGLFLPHTDLARFPSVKLDAPPPRVPKYAEERGA